MLKLLVTPALAVAVALAPASRSDAGDTGKIIFGLATAAIIGCATGAVKCSGPGVRTPPKVYDTPQLVENRKVQTALNTFGFDVGTADGVIGRGTKSGIANYQAYMGYPATGQLTDVEKNFLFSGLNQVNAGQSGQYASAIQRDGTKGMLKGLRGDPGYKQPRQVVPTLPSPQIIATPERLPEKLKKVQILERDTHAASISMSDRCEFVDLLGATNGVIKAGNITDPDRALTEKFCGMRGDAIGDGAHVMNSYGIDGAGAISKICGPITQEMKAHFPSLSAGDPEAMSAAAAQTIAKLGLRDPAMISDYGKMCLSAGYASDDPQIALSGALMMLSIKEYVYSETVAHHLREGFGVKPDVPAAISFYQAALSTFEQGAQPAFLPEQAHARAEVIRASVGKISVHTAFDETAMIVPVTANPVLPLLQKQ